MKSSTEQDLHKDNTFQTVRQNGSESQLSGIDNNRLRKLLEELYKDKKYFDEYIESKGIEDIYTFFFFFCERSKFISSIGHHRSYFHEWRSHE